jgi:hypothetical protein
MLGLFPPAYLSATPAASTVAVDSPFSSNTRPQKGQYRAPSGSSFPQPEQIKAILLPQAGQKLAVDGTGLLQKLQVRVPRAGKVTVGPASRSKSLKVSRLIAATISRTVAAPTTR